MIVRSYTTMYQKLVPGIRTFEQTPVQADSKAINPPKK